MRAIIITGAPGAGKSSALTALTDLLASEDVEHVTVEVDDLSRGHPGRDGRRHLRAFAVEAGLLLVAATVESPQYLDRLLDAIGCDEHALVALHARPETLVRRIRERETVPWSGLEAMVARTPALQEAIRALPSVDLSLDSERAAPEELARRSAPCSAREPRRLGGVLVGVGPAPRATYCAPVPSRSPRGWPRCAAAQAPPRTIRSASSRARSTRSATSDFDCRHAPST